MAMVMDSNREGTGLSDQGDHKRAYDCFKHALRWCPLPHELELIPAKLEEEGDAAAAKLSRTLRKYQWTLRRAAVANNLAMAALRCGWHAEASRLLEKEVIDNRQLALTMVPFLFPERAHFEETQLALAIAVARRHIASVVAAQLPPGSQLRASLSHLQQAKQAIETALANPTPEIDPLEISNQLAMTLNNMGTTHWNMSRHQDLSQQDKTDLLNQALSAFDQASAIFAQSEHPDLKVALTNLQAVHRALGNLFKAEEIKERIHAIQSTPVVYQQQQQDDDVVGVEEEEEEEDVEIDEEIDEEDEQSR